MEHDEASRHETKLPVEATSASRARGFVRERLDQHGLSYLRDDVQLVVSELATNSLVHAQTPFTVTLQVFEESVLLAVQDGSAAGPDVGSPRSLEVGGRGISIVQALSLAWGVTLVDGRGKSVWAEFAREATAETACAGT